MWVSAPLVFCFISHWWKEKMLYPNYLLLTSEFEACSTVLLWLQGLTSSRLAIDLGGTGSGPSPMPPVRSMLRADSQVQMDLQERKPPRAFSMTTHTGAAQKHRTSSMTGSPALGGEALLALLCTVNCWPNSPSLHWFPPLPDLLLPVLLSRPKSKHISFYFLKIHNILTFLAVLTTLALQKVHQT